MKGDGELSLDEVNTYRQVSLLTRKFSNPLLFCLFCLFCFVLFLKLTLFFSLFLGTADPDNYPVDIIDVHFANHFFGEYEVMTNVARRQHTMECRGVVIAFFISKERFQKLMADYPIFELEMWKRAAVTAIKVCSVDDMYNFRYEVTRNIRKAFQVGSISTPTTREAEAMSNPNASGKKKVELMTPSDHLFYIKEKVGTRRILSGPLIGEHAVLLDKDDVCIIFHLAPRHAMDVGLTATNIAAQHEMENKRKKSRKYSTFIGQQHRSSIGGAMDYESVPPTRNRKSSSFHSQTPSLSSLSNFDATDSNMRSTSASNDFERNTTSFKRSPERSTAVSEGDVHVDPRSGKSTR